MKIKYLCLDAFNGMLFIEVYIYNGLNKKCIKKKKVRIIRKNNKIQRRGFFMKKENKDKGITLVALAISRKCVRY